MKPVLNRKLRRKLENYIFLHCITSVEQEMSQNKLAAKSEFMACHKYVHDMVMELCKLEKLDAIILSHLLLEIQFLHSIYSRWHKNVKEIMPFTKQGRKELLDVIERYEFHPFMIESIIFEVKKMDRHNIRLIDKNSLIEPFPQKKVNIDKIKIEGSEIIAIFMNAVLHAKNQLKFLDEFEKNHNDLFTQNQESIYLSKLSPLRFKNYMLFQFASILMRFLKDSRDSTDAANYVIAGKLLHHFGILKLPVLKKGKYRYDTDYFKSNLKILLKSKHPKFADSQIGRIC